MKIQHLAVILALVFGAVSISGCASTPRLAQPADYAAVEYVAEVPGLKAPEVYDGLKYWIAENFRSAKQVIDYEDRANGVIIGNGVVPNIILSSGLAQISLNGSFKMKAEAKEGKFRLTFSQFEIVGRTNSVMYTTEIEQMKARLNTLGPSAVDFITHKRKAEF